MCASHWDFSEFSSHLISQSLEFHVKVISLIYPVKTAPEIKLKVRGGLHRFAAFYSTFILMDHYYQPLYADTLITVQNKCVIIAAEVIELCLT